MIQIGKNTSGSQKGNKKNYQMNSSSYNSMIIDSTNRRQKLMNHMRKTTGSEDSKTNESMIGLNKTSYSSTDNQNLKIG